MNDQKGQNAKKLMEAQTQKQKSSGQTKFRKFLAEKSSIGAAGGRATNRLIFPASATTARVHASSSPHSNVPFRLLQPSKPRPYLNYPQKPAVSDNPQRVVIPTQRPGDAFGRSSIGAARGRATNRPIFPANATTASSAHRNVPFHLLQPSKPRLYLNYPQKPVVSNSPPRVIIPTQQPYNRGQEMPSQKQPYKRGPWMPSQQLGAQSGGEAAPATTMPHARKAHIPSTSYRGVNARHFGHVPTVTTKFRGAQKTTLPTTAGQRNAAHGEPAMSPATAANPPSHSEKSGGGVPGFQSLLGTSSSIFNIYERSRGGVEAVGASQPSSSQPPSSRHCPPPASKPTASVPSTVRDLSKPPVEKQPGGGAVTGVQWSSESSAIPDVRSKQLSDSVALAHSDIPHSCSAPEMDTGDDIEIIYASPDDSEAEKTPKGEAESTQQRSEPPIAVDIAMPQEYEEEVQIVEANTPSESWAHAPVERVPKQTKPDLPEVPNVPIIVPVTSGRQMMRRKLPELPPHLQEWERSLPRPFDNMMLHLYEPPVDVRPSDVLKNPYLIKPGELLTTLRKIRENFEMMVRPPTVSPFTGGVPGQAPLPMHIDDLHHQPIRTMGDYRLYDRAKERIGAAPLREVEPQPKRLNPFGSPFKLGSIAVDEMTLADGGADGNGSVDKDSPDRMVEAPAKRRLFYTPRPAQHHR